jgi:hypothetical protein
MAKKDGLKLELLVICDYAAVSRDNKLTIAGIFDEVYVNSTPAQHPKLYVVGVVLGKANSDYRVNLRIKDPKGKDVFPVQEMDIKLGPNGKTNLIAEIATMPLRTTGDYLVEIGSKGKVIGKKELSIVEIKTKGKPSGKSKFTN